MLNSALASPRPLWALPSNTLRGVTHRSHATEPLLCTASLSQRYQLRQRPSIERRRRPADSSTSTPFAVCASTSSSSPSEPTPTPSNNNEARSNRATPVEGAVALVLECISLARKCDKEGLAARCRYPPPPGELPDLVFFGAAAEKKMKKKKAAGLGVAPEEGEEGEDNEGGEEEDEERDGKTTGTASPFSSSSSSALRGTHHHLHHREAESPLEAFAASGFDAGARGVLPRNLLRRAAVLSALELLGGGGNGGGDGEIEGIKRRCRLRRVLVRSRVVSTSGAEEATLVWRVEREEEGDGSNHGCWLVSSVERDDDGGGGGDEG